MKQGFWDRPATADARTDGQAAEDIFVRRPVAIQTQNGNTIVTLDAVDYRKGFACTFGQNNCLIHTLQQCLEATFGITDVNTHDVRSRMKLLFPPDTTEEVSSQNFLTFDLHWQAVVDTIGDLARERGTDMLGKIRSDNVTVSVVDESRRLLADYVGTGPHPLFILNEGGDCGGIHFVPLLPHMPTAHSSHLPQASYSQMLAASIQEVLNRPHAIWDGDLATKDSVSAVVARCEEFLAAAFASQEGLFLMA